MRERWEGDIWEGGERRERGVRGEREGGERGVRGKRRHEIGNIMLLNTDSRANKLPEITNNNIMTSLFCVNENIMIFFTISKCYKYTFLNLTYDFHFKNVCTNVSPSVFPHNIYLKSNIK